MIGTNSHDEVIKRSRLHPNAKQMNEIQALRVELLSASDDAHYNYDQVAQGDDLVSTAIDFAWTYRKVHELRLLKRMHKATHCPDTKAFIETEHAATLAQVRNMRPHMKGLYKKGDLGEVLLNT